jgi:hypothetical protein
MKQQLLARRDRNAFLFAADYTPFLAGRVDTFDTFKVDQFRAYYALHQPRLDPKEMFGIVAFPAIWNQRPREGQRSSSASCWSMRGTASATL